jgi:hypothetical protein
MSLRADCLAALEAHEQGNWSKAHALAQKHEGSPLADWIHAMLHRDEGDSGNAAHWYHLAGKPMSSVPASEERELIRQTIQSTR